jgi:hypothetical protein
VKPADWIVLTALTGFVAASYVWLWRPGGVPEKLVVEAPGGRQEFEHLDRPRVFDIEGARGTSRVEIRKGQARFISSPCRGQHCVLSGWLAKVGDVAACLPNQVVISFEGAEHRYDTINY